DPAAVAAFLLETERRCALADFDREDEAARIARVLSRTDSPASMVNHAALTAAQDWTGAFRRIACPTRIIHGSEDPILPLPNGRALAEGIPGARLTILPGTGHALPAAQRDTIADLIASLAR